MATERRKYTKDYKEAAVAMADREDKTVGQVARELGINAGMLGRWRSEMREAAQGEVTAFPGNGNARDEELVRLRKRVAELEEVNDILKKAAVIFAKAPLRSWCIRLCRIPRIDTPLQR